MSLLKRQVRPEFLNRIDDIVLFSPLTQKEITEIVKLQFKLIAQRLLLQEVKISATDEAIHQLARLGFDPQYGGRPVKRVLQQHILNPLSKDLLGPALDKSKEIVVDFFEDSFVFRNA